MANKRSTSGMFTIFNYGTPHSFYPNKKVIDPYLNAECTLLSIHQQKVKEANDTRLVYIIDDNGEQLINS